MNQSRSLQRRNLLVAAFGSSLLGRAWGSTYPDKPIKMVLPVQPGSAVDATARRLGPAVEALLGQPLVIDNRPGSAGLIATSQLVRSPADGYTLAMVASTHCITPHLYKASFHPIQDIQPIVALTSGPMVFVVHTAVPAKDIGQFVAHAKSRPDKQSVSMGNSGNGTVLHIASVLMSQKGEFKALHVAYKGVGALSTDLAGGQIEAAFLPLVVAVPLIKGGQIRALGISTPKRLSALPDVPTIAESGLAGFNVDGWVALIAPKGTPSAIVQRLNAVFQKALQTPDVERFIADGGGAAIGGTAKDCENLFQRDFAEYGRLIASAGIKAD
jgi:tripartite-type tricarboxylate transporter receptor subunit TctC